MLYYAQLDWGLNVEKWKKILRDAVRDPAELAERFHLSAEDLCEVGKVFPFRIPRPVLDRIKAPGDPLFLQCVPDLRELSASGDLLDDPLGEVRFGKEECIVQKYPDRCLFLVSGECAMYCRFCTRKRKFRGPFRVGEKQIDEGIAYIAAHKELRDVLISGGDPFLLDDDRIEYILRGVRSAKHIRIIRIGTRTPSMLPERITVKLVRMLKKYHPLYLNVHFNHPDELTPAAVKALNRLADAGIPLGSQTVLLKGVNDDPEVMRELMWKLLEARVKPYYIFQCDLIYGTEHFRTPLSKGIEIVKALRGWSSGMANPHFVIDLPKGGGKVPLVPDYLVKTNGRFRTYCNYCGEEYLYPDLDDTPGKD